MSSFAALVVAQGILEFEVISAVAIQDDFGSVLAHEEKNVKDREFEVLATWLRGPPVTRTIELASDLPDLVSSGQLIVTADPYPVAWQFLGDAAMILAVPHP